MADGGCAGAADPDGDLKNVDSGGPVARLSCMAFRLPLVAAPDSHRATHGRAGNTQRTSMPGSLVGE